MTRLITAWLVAIVLTGCGSEPPWNVLLVTFDTTRADHLGPYGHPTARTPTLDRLAAEVFVFEQANTSVPLTCPAHSTILTGTYPIFHGVRDNSFFVLPEERTTLAEVLRDRGYATGAAIGAFPLLSRFGVAQGFDFYDERLGQANQDFRGERIRRSRSLYFDERPAGRVNDALLPWLRDQFDRPFFAWLHYFDPHQPLQPPTPYDQIFASDPYLGELAYADESLGRVIAELEEAGVADRTLIVMAADHGEGRGEHDEATHALLAYESTMRVPLIMKVPDRAGGERIAQRVATVDILPTILDLLGIPSPDEVQGRSLVSLLDGGSGDRGRRPAYAETLAPRLMHGWGELRVLYQGTLKYIHGPRPELYDLAEDPRERRNLMASRSEDSVKLKDNLKAFLTRYAGDTAAAVQETDSETVARLAALGYLSSGGERPGVGPEELRSDGAPPQDHVGDVSQMSETKSLLHRQRFLEARAVARQLLKKQADSPFYLGLYAWSLAGLGQNHEAFEVLEGTPEPVAYMAGIYQQVGLEAFRQGERRRAVELVRRVNEAHGSAEGFYVLASMYEQLGETQAYLDALAASLQHDENFAPARLNVAIQLARDGHYEDAEREMRRTLEASPLYPLAHFNYARLLGEREREEDALAHLHRAIELNPRYWEAYLAQVALLLDLGRSAEATAVAGRLRQACSDPGPLRRLETLLASS
ncbi:MAG: sulfatase-like hydrolase/transferase [Acidobacteriota bacterium]